MEVTDAILIRQRPWGDTSLIITWFTKCSGKVTTIARGVKKTTSPFAGKIDLFYQSEIAYTASRKSSLHTLQEVRLLQVYDGEGLSCSNLFMGAYFADLTDFATEPGEAAPEIYDLLERAFGYLRTRASTRDALLHFEREFFRHLGVEGGNPLDAIATYCGHLPSSRAAALKFFSAPIT